MLSCAFCDQLRVLRWACLRLKFFVSFTWCLFDLDLQVRCVKGAEKKDVSEVQGRKGYVISAIIGDRFQK